MPNKYGGGSKTNQVGLNYEKKTSLRKALLIATKNGMLNLDPEDFIYKKGVKIGFLAEKGDLYKKFLMGIDYKTIISRQLLPDEALINEVNKTLYIIEKKYQEQGGSADEKLQTCDFKLKQYKKLAKTKGYDAKFIFLLDKWFNQTKYKDVLEYIVSVDCLYYFDEVPISVFDI
jgi:hypothetical protein